MMKFLPKKYTCTECSKDQYTDAYCYGCGGISFDIITPTEKESFPTECVSFEKQLGDSDLKAPRYKHYKGGIYKVLSLAIHTETQEEVVFYYDDKGRSWVRPSEMFFGFVEEDGEKRRRFEPVSK